MSLLSHLWDKKADSIALKRETVNADLSYCTKQMTLGLVFELWDPLGVMAPVSIRFRIDLQSLSVGWVPATRKKVQMANESEDYERPSRYTSRKVIKAWNLRWKFTTPWILRCGRIRIWRCPLPSMGTAGWQIYLQICCSNRLGCTTKKEDHTETRIDGLLGAESTGSWSRMSLILKE